MQKRWRWRPRRPAIDPALAYTAFTHLCRMTNLFRLTSLALAAACAPILAQAVTPIQLSDTAPTYTYQAKGPALLGSTNFDDGAANNWYAITYEGGSDSQPPAPAPSPWGTGQALKLSPQTLPNGAGIQYVLPIAFKKNRLYKISMNVGTCTNCATTFSLNMMADAAYQPIPSARTVKVTSTASAPYTPVTLYGVFTVSATNGTGDKGGWVRIFPKTAGVPIWIDDVKIEDIDANPLNFADRLSFGKASAATPIALDNKLFGLHVNKLGSHNAWPALGQEAWRLWDTPTRWAEVEPNPGATGWSLATMDYYINHVQLHKPDTAVIYTMGQSPSWASNSSQTTGCAYPELPGSCIPPTNLSDWDNYVQTVATRYKGKIQYFEIWNEVDIAENYRGDIQKLVDMTCHAKDVLRTVDASIKVVAPSFTTGGIPAFDAFLALGGGDCVDVVNYHNYFSPFMAESDIAGTVANMKFLMASYGLGNKPLWNTEGGAGCVAGISCPTNDTLSDSTLRGTIPRVVAMQWANGVSNFNYYFMEGFDPQQPWNALVGMPPAGSNCAQIPDKGCVDYMPLTALGQGFALGGKWLKSTKLYSAYVMPDQGIYIYKLRTTSGAMRYLVWSTAATAQAVKAPLNWNIKSLSRTDGTTSTLFYSTAGFMLNPLDPVLLAP